MLLRRFEKSLAFKLAIVPAAVAIFFGFAPSAWHDDDAPRPIACGGCGLAFAALDDKAPQPDTKPSAPESKPDAPAKPATPAPPPSTAGTLYDGIYFKDFQGKPVSFADAVGKPMIIEVWATWCGPCKQQREAMHAVSAKHPEIVFIGASIDEKGPSVVQEYISSHPAPKGSTVRDVMGTSELLAVAGKTYKSNTIPKLMFVNHRGQVVEVTGPQDPKFTEAMIKNLVKGMARDRAKDSAPDPSPKGK